jgi:flagellar biosynthesis protein FlhA
VSIRDLTTILEAIADAAALTKDHDAITESVRAAIGRAICRPYQNEKGEMPAISLAPALEERLLSSIVRTEQGAVLALDPTQAQRLASRIAEVFAAAVAQPVLLCSPALRPHLWRLFARVLPHLGVLSHSEIPPQMQVASIATLD